LAVTDHVHRWVFQPEEPKNDMEDTNAEMADLSSGPASRPS
jgi:hypothetical protein